MMKRILERHDDVGTVGFMLYADTNDKLYSDPDLKKPLSVEDISNAFIKGCVVSKDGVLSRPSALNADGTLSYGGGGGGSQKLYRHDIHITELYYGCNDIWFSIYNTDPTNYSAIAGFSEEEFEYTDPLTEEHFAFLPEAEIHASGAIDPSGTCMAHVIVTAIKYNPQTGIDVYGMAVDEGISIAQLEHTWSFDMTSEIIDTVTEV